MRVALVLVLAACGRIDFDPVIEHTVCPASYQAIGGQQSVYRLLSESLTWIGGESACLGDGAHLVVFDDGIEEAAVLPLLPTALTGDATWVGISDRATEGVFLTVEGDPAPFLPWESGEPNNSGDEDCVEVFTSDGSYNDLSCDELIRVLCECTPN